MGDNIFLEHDSPMTMEAYVGDVKSGRGNLGEEIPVTVYRMFEFAMREELCKQFGKEKQIEIFRNAGYQTGVYFAKNLLDTSLPENEFLAQLQAKLESMKIGILRIEKVNRETGSIVLNVAEDADCSGLPTLGETVCNYDEGFLAGVLSIYTGKAYQVEEVDCWATGNRVCRFRADVRK